VRFVWALKLLSAAVLVLWIVCFGRCLAEQYGSLTPPQQSEWCQDDCCQQDEPKTPVPNPEAPCDVCEFIKSGGALPTYQLLLPPPVICSLEITSFSGEPEVVVEEAEAPAEADTGRQRAVQMWEWMASTAAPVRGPNGFI
jgi:hypothetical protein